MLTAKNGKGGRCGRAAKGKCHGAAHPDVGAHRLREPDGVARTEDVLAINAPKMFIDEQAAPLIDGQSAGTSQIRNGEGRGPHADAKTHELTRVQDDCALGDAIHTRVLADINAEATERSMNRPAGRRPHVWHEKFR
ncbi:hypothetical protein GCM10011313_11720 [Mycetocola zhadangensis]|nr:hypothetical protein GCM10011313_11720 [Mycetocola zhadangensis]